MVSILDTSKLIYAQAYEAREFLDGRWYETEIIIFEYLSTLSINEPENLVINLARSRPKNITTNNTPLDNQVLENPLPENERTLPPSREEQLLESLVIPDEACLGYPNLPKRDSLHPKVLAAGITSESIDQYSHFNPKNSIASQEHTFRTDDSEEPSISLVEDRKFAYIGNDSRLRKSDGIDLLSAIGEFNNGLQRTSFTWLPNENFELGDEYTKLKRSADIRPIFHGRWRQAVPDRDKGEPISIAFNDPNSPQTLAQQFSKIEGLISLTAQKFLHLKFRLWYHSDGLGISPETMPTNNETHKLKKGYMELAETRRMRSQELHYFDHPKIGVLAYIDEVKSPQILDRSLENLLSPRIANP